MQLNVATEILYVINFYSFNFFSNPNKLEEILSKLKLYAIFAIFLQDDVCQFFFL